jgi:hypothetical protein
MEKQECRSCKKPIVFLRTAKGAMMPVDAETVKDGDILFDGSYHKSHFATCPNAEKWRKK